MSILLYECTTLMLRKCIEKKLDGNYTRMQQAILNKSWKQHLTKQQLYSYLPSISKTIQVRQTRHVGHCWRSKDKLISDVLLWTPTHGHASVGWLERTYSHQLCAEQNVVWKTCREWRMIEMDGEGEREKSGKFMLSVQLDDK